MWGTIYVFITMFMLVVWLFLFRMTMPSEIDDVSPEIVCEKELLLKSDVLWVIPLYNNHSIANNREWCDYIKYLDKKVGMHGVYHEYHEFNITRDREYVMEGISVFEECIGYRPERFKPPQLLINEENTVLIESLGMSVKTEFNQVTRKVYHCDDEPEVFSNLFIEMF